MNKVVKFCMFICFCIATNSAYSQELNNKNIKFNVFFTKSSIGPTSPSRYLIQVEVSEDIRSAFRKLKSGAIDSLLRNETTDWATNLLLYDIYEKDATAFLILATREQWIYKRKAEDLAYWKKKLVEQQ